MLSRLMLPYAWARQLIAARRDWTLQVALWALWTLAVAATGYLNWRSGVEGIGLVIHCVVVGIIGLVVMTKIEMRCQPDRFLE